MGRCRKRETCCCHDTTELVRVGGNGGVLGVLSAAVGQHTKGRVAACSHDSPQGGRVDTTRACCQLCINKVSSRFSLLVPACIGVKSSPQLTISTPSSCGCRVNVLPTILCGKTLCTTPSDGSTDSCRSCCSSGYRSVAVVALKPSTVMMRCSTAVAGTGRPLMCLGLHVTLAWCCLDAVLYTLCCLNCMALRFVDCG